MSTMSNLHAEVEAFADKLGANASHLVDEFHALVAKLLGYADGGEAQTIKTTAADAPAQSAPAAVTKPETPQA